MHAFECVFAFAGSILSVGHHRSAAAKSCELFKLTSHELGLVITLPFLVCQLSLPAITFMIRTRTHHAHVYGVRLSQVIVRLFVL